MWGNMKKILILLISLILELTEGRRKRLNGRWSIGGGVGTGVDLGLGLGGNWGPTGARLNAQGKGKWGNAKQLSYPQSNIGYTFGAGEGCYGPFCPPPPPPPSKVIYMGTGRSALSGRSLTGRWSIGGGVGTDTDLGVGAGVNWGPGGAGINVGGKGKWNVGGTLGFGKDCYGPFCPPPPAPTPTVIYYPPAPPRPPVYIPVPGPPVYVPVGLPPPLVTPPPGTYDCCIVGGRHFCNSQRCLSLSARTAWRRG